ncbi:hypothetical protein ATL17_0709 [Maritalea mobilis]|uniref:Uncharacterized protein n=1 Tax=Maritalea mobilis TaxID=483324 RepID=A0A4R6VVC6_9HYPH|nr:hypothetical protein ATL17_0709 [Maritalea mobilis]
MSGIQMGLSAHLIIKVIPIRIALFNEFQLPFAVPLFQRLLARDGTFEIVVLLEMDEYFHIVLLGETIHLTFAMLPHAPHQIIGHAYI